MLAQLALENTTYRFDKPFTYSVPQALEAAVRPGVRVTVPFGAGNRTRVAMVLSTSYESGAGQKLKAIASVLDKEPLLDDEMLALIPWMKSRCFCTLYDAVKVMIPAGTVHASGRNQVILEIGSLTVGSYTYKLYDYQRIDPQTGLPRPIHLKMGRDVIHPERTAEFVRDNLVNHGGIVRQGEDWCEKVVGEHDLLYFSLRNLVFTTSMEDDTRDDFHVLALVDGEKVRVESVEDPSRYFDLNMLDIVVVPATFGKYRVVNKGIGVAVIHKTMLKP